MKYIKLFENFDDGFEEYKEDPTIDNRFKSSRSEDINQEDIEIIENLLKDIEINRTGVKLLSGKKCIYFYYSHPNYQSIFYVTISKFNDDWFLICDFNLIGTAKYYECDQLDGVLNCIKYLINKK